MKLFTSACRRVILWELPLARRVSERPAVTPVECRELGREEAAIYHAFRPRHGRVEFRGRLERGDRCFAAWVGDRVVSAGWLATGRGPIPYLRAELPLEPDECFLYDAYTIPEMRRMGVTRARKSFILSWCRERGFRCALCVVAIENRAALASVRESGFEAIGTYGWWRVPGRPRWRRASGDRPLPRLVPAL